MKNTNPIVVQRATQKRKEQEERELQLLEDMNRDPRRKEYHNIGLYDTCWIKPLIEDE